MWYTERIVMAKQRDGSRQYKWGALFSTTAREQSLVKTIQYDKYVWSTPCLEYVSKCPESAYNLHIVNFSTKLCNPGSKSMTW